MLKHVTLFNDFNCTKISFENLNIRKSYLFVTIVIMLMLIGICAISPLEVIPYFYLNLKHPNISIQILHTLPYTFPLVLTMRIHLSIKTS